MDKISSQISNVKFQKAFSGYSKDEVDLFINTILDSVKDLEDEFAVTLKELNGFKKVFREFEDEKARFKERERVELLELETMKKRLKREADIDIDGRVEKINQREKRHSDIIRAYRDEIKRLKKLRESIVIQMKYLVRQQMDTINLFEKIERERDKDGI